MVTHKKVTLLADAVSVQQSSTRSINVEKDLSRQLISESYILTTQARRSLARLLSRAQAEASQRAWTLTGPYGSGKSYFGLFLMSLLCTTAPAHEDARSKLAEVDPGLWQGGAHLARSQETKGFLPMPITGYRAPIQECIRQGMQRAVESLPTTERLQALLTDLTTWRSETPTHRLVEMMQVLLRIVTEEPLGYSGITLILDEMGKPLEYTSAHPDKSDIFLLQELAELANRSGQSPLIFVGILHQSFERYAGFADSLTQREWAKIQGRFEDVAFQEPPTQQMWLLANALTCEDSSLLPEEWSTTVIDQAIDEGWTPALLNPAEFRHLCEQALPFHPTALIAIPYLFQRLAQNERSMFAYLTSSEPRGFQAHLQTLENVRQIRLADLFDYVAVNYQGRLYSMLRARPLTETLERIESTPNLSPLDVSLLKTIGILHWLAEIGPFRASTRELLFALRGEGVTDEKILSCLERLNQQSTIVFRRYNQTYAIWQGSDVNVEERLGEARRQHLDGFSVAQAIQQYLPPQPIVARRHSYRTGTTRFFETQYVDWRTRESVSLTPKETASGLILLCLPESANQAEAFLDWAQQEHFRARGDLVIGLLAPIPRLVDLLGEMRCLHWVRNNTPELRDDPVARRELRTRLSELESLVKNELDTTIRLHRPGGDAGIRWLHRGEIVELPPNRGVSFLFSFVCEHLYDQSPILHNEILNRRQLSSQGSAARRNLIEGMLLHADEPLLGIEGFPPERSMYESLLKAGGLHRQEKETEGKESRWKLTSPPEDDPLQLRGVWQCIHDYVFAQPPQPRGVQELYDRLSQPPYGVTEGVLPLLICHCLQVYRDETTLYSEGTLLPEPGIADWEVLLRRPELYAVAGCRIVGPRKAVVDRLARGLQTAPAAMPVVRDLIRRLKSLPEHTWRTQRLSEKTLAARQAIDQARSPESLLFQDLPRAFQLQPFADSQEIDQEQIEAFFSALNSTLQELNDAMPRLLEGARDQLLETFHLPEGQEGWHQFLVIAAELESKVTPPLSTLLHRVAEAADSANALESALAYVANRPPRSWTDRDREGFENRLVAMGRQFLQAQRTHLLELGLTEEQRRQKEKIASTLQKSLTELAEAQDPIVVRAALHALMESYQPEGREKENHEKLILFQNGRKL